MVRTGWKTFLAVLPAVLLLAPAASAADASLESAPAGQTTLADNPFAPPPLSEECTEFCGLCAEETGKGKKKNGMCERVEAKCGCAAHAEAVRDAEALLAKKAAKDSAQRAEQARIDSARKATVVDDMAGYLRGACKADTCRLSFVVDKNPAPTSEATASDDAAQTKNPFAPPPLGEECSEFCGECGAPKKGRKDPMCEKVEAKCGCAAHAEAVAAAERLFAEKVAKEKAERDAAAARSLDAAKQILEFCERETATPLCSVSVVLDRAWFAVVDLRLFRPEPPPAPVVAQQPAYADEPAQQPAYEPAPREERESGEESENRTKAGTSFGVIEWGLGMTREDHYGGLPFRQTNGFEMSLLYLKRFYFYEAGSFQLGLGLDYNAIMTDDEVYISDYYYGYYYTDLYEYRLFHHGITLEIPIGLRLGLPLGPKFKPFVSENIAFRHTIHESAYIRVDGDDLWEYHWPEFGDWAFMAWFGAGVEFNRFSLEFRWMEYSGQKGSAQDFRRNWRFVLGFGL